MVYYWQSLNGTVRENIQNKEENHEETQREKGSDTGLSQGPEKPEQGLGQSEKAESEVVMDGHGDVQYQYHGLFGSESENPEEKAIKMALKLTAHIEAMANDAYLTGHPEWIEICEESLEVGEYMSTL